MTDPTHRYESDLLRSIGIGFVIGFVALMLTIIAYTIGTHHIRATTPSATPTNGSPSTGGGSSRTAARQLFIQTGCGGCHTFTPAGATGTIGPNLADAAKAAKADHNMALAAYLHQSITDPNAYITAGYHAGVMPTYYPTKLTPTQITDLVA